MNIDTKAHTFQVRTLSDPSRPISILGTQFEDQYLRVLGPTTFLLLRHLARSATPTGVHIDAEDVAKHLGLPGAYKLRHAIGRAEHFGFIEADSPTSFGVWTSADISAQHNRALAKR